MWGKEKELEGLLQREEEFWRLRLRTNWLTQGDRNTRYFHHHASQRKKKNYLEGLLNSKKELITNHVQVEEMSIKFFVEFFSTLNQGGAMKRFSMGLILCI